MVKKQIVYIMLILISIILFFNVSKVSAAGEKLEIPTGWGFTGSVSEFKDFLSDNYGTMYVDPVTGNMQTRAPGGKIIYANTSWLEVHAYLFYGTAHDANALGLFDGSNTWYGAPINNNRFMGVTQGNRYVFPNRSIPEDVNTWGDPINRKFIDWRNSDIKNGIVSKTKIDVPWNRASHIAGAFLDEGVDMSEADAQILYEKWLDAFDDHYARNHEYYKNKPGSVFKRYGDTSNHFLRMSKADRGKLAFIVQPPTEYTYGTFLEWHWYGGDTNSGSHLYDSFNINPLLSSGINFKATKLDLNLVGDTVDINFTVKNDSENEEKFKEKVKTTLRVFKNGLLIYEDANLEVFQDVWGKDESQTVNLGEINVGSLQDSDEIRVYAEFNTPTRTKKEKTYTDNAKTTAIKKPKQEMCPFGGSGSTKIYQVRVCGEYRTATDYYTNPDGSTYSYTYTYCAWTYCDNRTIALRHNVSFYFNEDRQALLGMWSSNTSGHLKYKGKVQDATNADVVNEKWKEKISSNSVPGVSKLKRVIRAGRSLQMYGTIEIDMRIESFVKGTLDNSQKAFVQALINDLKTVGLEVDSSNDAGIVTNEQGKDKVPAQVDSSRVKNDGKYIKYSAGGVGEVIYGSNTCLPQVPVYDKSYTFEIPVKTKNTNGKQDTSNGDYKPKLSYDVNSGVADFFTNVNTRNGVHGMKFITTLTGNRIDPGFGATKECDTLPEEFAVQGNIYDDIRTEEVEVEEDNWDW